MDDDDLYRRGLATLVASWAAYARGAAGAAVRRLPGVAAAVFPRGPERDVYNNALLEGGLAAAGRAAAIASLEDAYAAAGVTRFAAWVHERDAPLQADLERRGYVFDSATRAMGLSLDELRGPRRPLDARAVGLERVPARAGRPRRPPGRGRPRGVPRPGRALERRERRDRDGVRPRRRLRGLQRHDARRRPPARPGHRPDGGAPARRRRARSAARPACSRRAMAEGVYAAAGFRDLGRILEYVPPAAATSAYTRTVRPDAARLPVAVKVTVTAIAPARAQAARRRGEAHHARCARRPCGRRASCGRRRPGGRPSGPWRPPSRGRGRARAPSRAACRRPRGRARTRREARPTTIVRSAPRTVPFGPGHDQPVVVAAAGPQAAGQRVDGDRAGAAPPTPRAAGRACSYRGRSRRTRSGSVAPSPARTVPVRRAVPRPGGVGGAGGGARSRTRPS